jgi:hypothetical protein
MPSPRAAETLWDPLALGDARLGSVWRGALNFEEEQQYLGLLPWVFLAGGALSLARGARREAGLFAALLGVGLVCGSLAYGWPPLHDWLASQPPFSWNRNPRFRLFVECSALVLAFLAARGWRGSLAARSPRHAALALAVLAAALAAVLLGLGLASRFGPRPLVALAAACALWFAGAFAAGARERRLVGALVPALLLADLAPVYAGYHPQPPRSWAELDRAVAELPAALREARPLRLAAQDFSPPNLPALLGAVDPTAYSLPVAARSDLFQRRLLGLSDPDRLTRADLVRPDVVRALETTCADYLWTNVPQQGGAADGLALLDERRGLRLYHLRDAAPWAAWHASAEVASAPGLDAALARLVAARGVRPEPIVVEDGAAREPAATVRPGERAAAMQRSPQRIDVELPAAAASGDGWLVVRTSFDRGWRAESRDGRALRVVPAQLRFLGVEVPAATEGVVLRYAPPHFAAACAASAGALLLAGAAFAWTRRRA